MIFWTNDTLYFSLRENWGKIERLVWYFYVSISRTKEANRRWRGSAENVKSAKKENFRFLARREKIDDFFLLYSPLLAPDLSQRTPDEKSCEIAGEKWKKSREIWCGACDAGRDLKYASSSPGIFSTKRLKACFGDGWMGGTRTHDQAKQPFLFFHHHDYGVEKKARLIIFTARRLARSVRWWIGAASSMECEQNGCNQHVFSRSAMRFRWK